MRIIKCLMLAAAIAGGSQKGLSDMPMLNWMGREKAAKATKDVVMKILRENRELSYGGFSTQRRRGAERESVITGASHPSSDLASQGSLRSGEEMLLALKEQDIGGSVRTLLAATRMRMIASK